MSATIPRFGQGCFSPALHRWAQLCGRSRVEQHWDLGNGGISPKTQLPAWQLRCPSLGSPCQWLHLQGDLGVLKELTIAVPWMPPHRSLWAIEWTWLCPPGTAATPWARLGRAGHGAYQEAASPHRTTEILLWRSLLLGFGGLCRQEQLSHTAGMGWGPEKGSAMVPREHALRDYVWKSDWGAPGCTTPWGSQHWDWC